MDKIELNLAIQQTDLSAMSSKLFVPCNGTANKAWHKRMFAVKVEKVFAENVIGKRTNFALSFM